SAVRGDEVEETELNGPLRTEVLALAQDARLGGVERQDPLALADDRALAGGIEEDLRAGRGVEAVEAELVLLEHPTLELRHLHLRGALARDGDLAHDLGTEDPRGLRVR